MQCKFYVNSAKNKRFQRFHKQTNMTQADMVNISHQGGGKNRIGRREKWPKKVGKRGK